MTLARNSALSVTVFEASQYHDHRVGEVLSAEGSGVLRQLGFAPEFLRKRHLECVGFCSSWQDDQPGYLDLIASPIGSAWHLDRRRFNADLAAATAEAGSNVKCGYRAEQASRCADGGFTVGGHRSDGRAFSTHVRILVDATGRNARLARSLGARVRRIDRMVAFYSIFEGSSADRMTRIEAVRDGWWYVAGLPAEKTVACFLTDTDIAHRLGLGCARTWHRLLNETRNLRPFMEISMPEHASVRAVPAQSSILEVAQGAGWIAIGDAAISYDPASSQGIVAALKSGMEAAEQIIAGAVAAPLSARQARLERRFQRYLDLRASYYGLVRRWPGSAFWDRRQLARASSTRGHDLPSNWLDQVLEPYINLS